MLRSKLAPGTSLADLLASVQQQRQRDEEEEFTGDKDESRSLRRAMQHGQSYRLAKISEVDYMDDAAMAGTAPAVMAMEMARENPPRTRLLRRHTQRPRPKSARRRKPSQLNGKHTRRKRPKSARRVRSRSRRGVMRKVRPQSSSGRRRVYMGEQGGGSSSSSSRNNVPETWPLDENKLDAEQREGQANDAVTQQRRARPRSAPISRRRRRKKRTMSDVEEEVARREILALEILLARGTKIVM